MSIGRQLDLFDGGGVSTEAPPPFAGSAGPVAASELDDAALIDAIARAGLRDYRDLTEEAVQRRLAEAIPALETLCRRFTGFGLTRPIPEQIAAVQAIASIGGSAASRAVAAIIADDVIRGPGFADAVHQAARLRCRLPDAVVLDLLRHPDSAMRADGASCAHRPRADIVALLADLLNDPHQAVARAAACALGRMGRGDAQPILLRLLAEQPSQEVIEAAAGIEDEAIIVLLGRIARTRPELAAAAMEALRDMEHGRATAIVASIEGSAGIRSITLDN
nr:HEAT repeat domain-containing protein [uncultured Rhodopila sp.]